MAVHILVPYLTRQLLRDTEYNLVEPVEFSVLGTADFIAAVSRHGGVRFSGTLNWFAKR
jgi:hypothetical protein